MSGRRRLFRRTALVLGLLVAGCQSHPPPGLKPIEQPVTLQSAAPRISGPIARQRQRQRVFESRGVAAVPTLPPERVAELRKEGDITLNFADTDVREIAHTILGTMLKVNYAIDPKVHGTATLQTGRPVARTALLPMLESVLAQNGATVIEKNGLYQVVPLPAGAAVNPVASPASPEAGTQIVPLRYASADRLAKLLAPYVAEGGKITPAPDQNALIVSGGAATREALVALIRGFDIDVLAGQSYALYSAGDTSPKMLASELEGVLRAQRGGSLARVVRVLPLQRANAVLVISRQPRYLAAATRYLRLALRAENETARAWHVYYVQNGKAANLANLLQRAFTPGHVTAPAARLPGATAPGAVPKTLGAGPSDAGGSGSGSGLTTPATTGPSASLFGSTAAGDKGRGPESNAAGQGPSSAGASAASSPAPAPASEPLSPETASATGNQTRIIADPTNNSLLIYATPSEYGTIEAMLRKIDVVPLQVLIDATIAEVTLNNQLKYGTQFFFRVAGNLNQLNAPPAPTFAPLATLPDLPTGFTGFVLSRTPHVALEALAAVTKVDVLSSPQVMVLDNQPARLQVGQQVPVLTGTAQSTLTTGAPIVNSVDYRDTGVILDVTPRVNSGGLVTLDIAQEVSNVTGAATNTVSGSPTFDDRIIRTRVAIQDGQTVGLAGLIQDTSETSNSGIPWLKDIPILGSLVSSQDNTRNRRELLVLITPHVIRDQREARALTDDLRHELINAAVVPGELAHKPQPGLSNPNGL